VEDLQLFRAFGEVRNGGAEGVGHVAVEDDELLEGGELREVEAVWGVVFYEN
jgi:hypothetical protein